MEMEYDAVEYDAVEMMMMVMRVDYEYYRAASRAPDIA
jgi:hypothetical protein